MAKIVSFSNQKGGVGKTTTCINLASYLATEGKKCLIVDLDPQGNATTGLGVSKSDLEFSVYDLLVDESCDPAEIIIRIDENLDLLPASVDLAGAEIDLVQVVGRERRLKRAIDKIARDYDYVAIDCPPSLGLLTVNALTASNSVLIPLQSEYFALEGLAQLLNTIKLVKTHLNPDLEVEGVVITMLDGRTTVARQICDEVRKYFGKRVYQTVIPRNVRLAEAPSHGKPVGKYDEKCSGAKAYFALTQEFIKRQNL